MEYERDVLCAAAGAVGKECVDDSGKSNYSTRDQCRPDTGELPASYVREDEEPDNANYSKPDTNEEQDIQDHINNKRTHCGSP